MTTRRAIVVFPRIETPDAWARVCALRDRFDPLAASIAPHLTLVFPHEDPVPDEVLAAEVRDVASRTPAFRVVLRGVTAHEGTYLFLNVKRGNDAVVALHDALYAGVLAPHRPRRHTFVPHVTVGRVAPESLDAALVAAAGCDGEVVGWVERLTVYTISPQGVRTRIVEAALDAGANAEGASGAGPR